MRVCVRVWRGGGVQVRVSVEIFPPVVTTVLMASAELSGRQSAGPRPQRDSRGGVKVTAEECLPARSLSLTLFAMVSSDCHVRNARAGTTGTWNVTLCDEFSRREVESPLVRGPHPRSLHISDIAGAVRKKKKKESKAATLRGDDWNYDE